MRPEHSVEDGGIALRGLEESDAEGPYLGWLQDPDVTRFLEARFSAYDRARLAAYIRAQNESPGAVLFGIFTRAAGAQVGTIKLGQIRREHRNCEVGLMIGDKAAWGQGIGTHAIRLVCRYAFETLCLHKVQAGVYSNNPASLRAFEKAGFLVEGRQAEDRLSDAGWVDKILVGQINPRERRAVPQGGA